MEVLVVLVSVGGAGYVRFSGHQSDRRVREFRPQSAVKSLGLGHALDECRHEPAVLGRGADRVGNDDLGTLDECERQHDGRDESWALHEDANGVVDVLNE